MWSGLCDDILLITIAPELQALLFVREAHAIVAVGQSILARGAIQQVDVGRTVRRCPGAVLWQIAGPFWPSAHGTSLLQLVETEREQGVKGELGRERIHQHNTGDCNGATCCHITHQKRPCQQNVCQQSYFGGCTINRNIQKNIHETKVSNRKMFMCCLATVLLTCGLVPTAGTQ